MFSLKSTEGLMTVDHRESPGLTDEQGHQAHLPVGVGGRGLSELPAYTCSHCQTVVIFNILRTRSREWCARCDRIICDKCSAVMAQTGDCANFERFAETLLNQASKGNVFNSLAHGFVNPGGEILPSPVPIPRN